MERSVQLNPSNTGGVEKLAELKRMKDRGSSEARDQASHPSTTLTGAAVGTMRVTFRPAAA